MSRMCIGEGRFRSRYFQRLTTECTSTLGKSCEVVSGARTKESDMMFDIGKIQAPLLSARVGVMAVRQNTNAADARSASAAPCSLFPTSSTSFAALCPPIAIHPSL